MKIYEIHVQSCPPNGLVLAGRAWSFLTSYLVERYLERCLQLQTLTQTLIKMLKYEIPEIGK